MKVVQPCSHVTSISFTSGNRWLNFFSCIFSWNFCLQLLCWLLPGVRRPLIPQTQYPLYWYLNVLAVLFALVVVSTVRKRCWIDQEDPRADWQYLVCFNSWCEEVLVPLPEGKCEGDRPVFVEFLPRPVLPDDHTVRWSVCCYQAECYWTDGATVHLVQHSDRCSHVSGLTGAHCSLRVSTPAPSAASGSQIGIITTEASTNLIQYYLTDRGNVSLNLSGGATTLAVTPAAPL